MKYGVLIDVSASDKPESARANMRHQSALKEPVHLSPSKPSKAARQLALDLGAKLQKFLGLS